MNFKIEGLSEQEVNTILAGLGELPAKLSIELISKIKMSCDEQYKEYKESEE